MGRSRPEIVGVLAALAALAASAGPPQTAPTDLAARIAAEREQIDRRIREGPTSPFTPVAVRMVREGERAAAGICRGAFRFDPPADCTDVATLQWTAGAFRLVGADGAESEAKSPVSVGRFLLALSRQEDRGRILVHDPQNPAQKAFEHLLWFPADPAYRFDVEIEPFAERTTVRMGTTAGLVKSFQRFGRVGFTLGGAPRTLAVYLAEGDDPGDPSAFFIPFRDATSGVESYAVGRYASLQKGADGRLVLDFNMAGSPNCAYNPYWNCPIPPAENVLDVAIRAGELAYPHGS